MSHPMFDRMTRRMEALQREIDKTHKAGEGAASSQPTKPPAAAPQGILQAPVQRPNGTTRQPLDLGTESVGGSLVPADVWERIGAALHHPDGWPLRPQAPRL